MRTKMEPQFPMPTPQLAGMWLAQRRAPLGEQVDPKLDLAELVLAQRLQPFDDLRFQLDLTPSHIPR